MYAKATIGLNFILLVNLAKVASQKFILNE